MDRNGGQSDCLEDTIVYTLAIIGAGPRGLSVLERLIALHVPGRTLRVEMVDPQLPGVGAHPITQPDYLLANTVAGQITVFRHDDPDAAPGGVTGPSLAEWAGCATDVYLPRRRLGEYFAFAFEHLRRRLPAGLELHVHRASAQRLSRTAQGWDLDLDDGTVVRTDFVVLASGHGTNRPTADEDRLSEFAASARSAGRATAFLPRVYPLSALETIQPGSRVAVRGMGLSAIDVVLALTVGRGGRFVRGADGERVYRASGAEPVIGVYSRYGRAFWPRARNQKSPADVYRPEHLTVDHVRSLRARGKIDFGRDIVPLLLRDIERASSRLAPHADLRAIADALTSPIPAGSPDPAVAQRRLVEFYRLDERRAAAGNMHDPFKAGADAIRDLRNEIRTVVEHGGLTAESHRQFVEVYAPLLHVISAGPPRVRAREWRALFDAGVLRMLPSPSTLHLDADRGRFVLQSDGHAPAEVDVVVSGAVEAFLPERDASALVRDLLVDGHARIYLNDGYHPGGFDIDAAGRLRDARGSVHPDLFAVGNPTEGPHYFTNMLPAPGLASRITADAEVVVRSLHARALRVRVDPPRRKDLVP